MQIIIVIMYALFLSTLSLRRATPEGPAKLPKQIRISIHALLAESDNNINSSVTTADKISIHALLAESDTLKGYRPARTNKISIHALLAESDQKALDQLTGSTYFYPRSPCGERR